MPRTTDRLTHALTSTLLALVLTQLRNEQLMAEAEGWTR